MPGMNIESRSLNRGNLLLVSILLALLLALALTTVASAQDGDITKGSEIYDANCAVCHGSDGQGRLGANLSGAFPSIDPSAFLHEIIAKGVQGSAMPAWSQQYGGPLTEEEVADVVAFVDSLSGGRSPMAPTATPLLVTPVPTVPGSTGDPGQGRVLFIENCAMCHGEQGQGRVGANLDKAFSSIAPQQFVRATVARGVEGTAMPAWSQANGGPLSEVQIDDISAYIIGLGGASGNATTPQEPQQGNTSSGLVALLILIAIGIGIIAALVFAGRRQAT